MATRVSWLVEEMIISLFIPAAPVGTGLRAANRACRREQDQREKRPEPPRAVHRPDQHPTQHVHVACLGP
jgi:hypothetical protein